MDSLFNELGLNETLINGLLKDNINSPTGIQTKVIPLALDNKDIIGQSETGTGKTLAYLLPIFEKMDMDIKTPQAIILSPTHELAAQIQKEVNKLANNSTLPIKSALIIGEVNIKRQLEKLKEKPHIIIGTSGRILELIKMKKLKCHTVKTIIVDEADRLLDSNNIGDVTSVINSTLRDRQLMFFSATMPEDIIKISETLMNKGELIKVEKENSEINPDIEHLYFLCEKRDKIAFIRKLYASIKPTRSIVFLNNSFDIESITDKLQYHNLKVDCVHGSSVKIDRHRSLDDLRMGKINILVASDLAARGLDIQGVSHIFNFDIPEDPKVICIE